MTQTNAISTDLRQLKLHELAVIIDRNWGAKMYFGAVPYVEAMHTLDSIRDNYGADTGEYIVRYFLTNAGTWRGPVAREVKAELRRRVK